MFRVFRFPGIRAGSSTMATTDFIRNFLDSDRRAAQVAGLDRADGYVASLAAPPILPRELVETLVALESGNGSSVPTE